MIFGHITNKSLAKIYRLVVLKLVDMEDSVIHTYLKSIKSIFNFFLVWNSRYLFIITCSQFCT